MTGLGNIAAVARREYMFRVRTRGFIVGTICLLVAVIAIALAPVIIRAIDQNNQSGWPSMSPRPTCRRPRRHLFTLLNASTGTGQTARPATPDFVVSAVPDLGPARQAVDVR